MNRRLIALLVAIGCAISFEAAADGKFCVVTNFGQSCMYNDAASCQDAARAQGGICSVNQEQPSRPPVRFDPGGSYNKGYSAGAEVGARLRAIEAERRRANFLPIPVTFVEKCRALTAFEDGIAENMYAPEDVGSVAFRAGTCFGYISGYINALKQNAGKFGVSCSPRDDAYAIARQIAAFKDESIVSSKLGLPALLLVSQSWHCE